MARVRAAIYTEGDALDRRHFSGTSRSMALALGPYLDLVHVERRPVLPGTVLAMKVIRRLFPGFDPGWSLPFMRLATLASRRRLRRARPDVVLVISSSPLTALIASRHRAVNISDGTGPQMVDYYREFSDWPRGHRDRVVRVSIRAVRKAWLNTLPSRWACASAVEDCGTAPANVAEIPWGPNLEPMPEGRVRDVASPLRLLFVGFHWQRKGGRIATDAVRELQRRGKAVELDLLGNTRPADEPETPGIRFHGVLDKRDPAQAARIAALFDQAHAFILPTEAECFGMSLSEAMAHGLPVLTTRTGGMDTVVKHSETGLLVPPDSPASVWADAVTDLFADPARYRAMSRAAIEDVATRLNWDVWGRELARVLEERLAE